MRQSNLLATSAAAVLVAAHGVHGQFAVFDYAGEVLGSTFISDTIFADVTDDQVFRFTVVIDTTVPGEIYQNSLVFGTIIEDGIEFEDAVVNIQLRIADSFPELDTNPVFDLCTDLPAETSSSTVTVRTRDINDPNNTAGMLVTAFDGIQRWGVSFSFFDFEGAGTFDFTQGVPVPTDSTLWRIGTYEIRGGTGAFRGTTQTNSPPSAFLITAATGFAACTPCLADYDLDGIASAFDAAAFFADVAAGAPETDIAPPSGIDVDDVDALLEALAIGCDP
ncbi:MAG: hypothetical protein AAGI30_11330 [Planctomycetota bacterium]